MFFKLIKTVHCGFSLMLLEIIKKAIILHVKALIFVSFNFAAAAVVIVFFFPHIYLTNIC